MLAGRAIQPVSRLHAKDEVQLCGGEWVKVAENGTVDEVDLWQVDALRSAALGILDRLARSSHEFERATSVWLQSLIEDEKARSAEPSASEPSTADPVGGAAVAAPLSPAQQQALLNRRVALERLASSAVSTTDSRVYALALRACAKAQTEGSCEMLSAQQWARLDPGNARPWLFILADSVAKKDAALRNEALFQIASASQMEDRLLALPGLIVGQASGDESLVAAMSLAIFAIGAGTAEVVPYQAISTSCKDIAGNANLGQICSSAASTLAKSNTLVDRTIGVAFGRRLGWPAEVGDRLAADNRQLWTPW